jgi:hypothetical protein
VYNYGMNSLNNYPSDSPILIGSEPQNIQWTVVRGDDASATFEWYENDGVTLKDTSTWSYASSAYDPKTSTKYSLICTAGTGNVTVSIPNATSALWGTGSSNIVARLSFDLQITIDGKKWTPVIGNIVVQSDISGSSL